MFQTEYMNPARRGFTLIELMVVITLIAILSTIALFGIGKVQASARDVKRSSTMNGIQTALERYYADNQQYPTGGFQAMVGTLVTGGYLASVPKDPAGNCTTACAQSGGTWQPCGTIVYPQYIYDSSATAYAKGVTAGCTIARSCYFMWLRTEASGATASYLEYSSPQ